MDRLTPAARALLQRVDRREAVLHHALAMSCGEVDIEHVRLGIAIDAARQEEHVGSAA